MTREVDLTPGTVFLVGDDTLLMESYECLMVRPEVIGEEHPDPVVWAVTFTGKVNRRDERRSVTIMMKPEDAASLQSTMADQIIELLDVIERARASHPDA